MKRPGAPASSPASSEKATETAASPTLVPKLRFPEFRKNLGWTLLPLRFACQMQAGKSVQTADIFDKPGDGLFPCYGGNGLRGYTKTFTHSGRYPLIGRQGALCGNVKLANGDFHATEHAVVVSPRVGINVDWLFHTLELSNLNQYATGQAQPGVSVEVLEKVSIAIPVEEIEQEKIAECLSTLDELIVAESQKLDALKAHKKGLMQQLFPREGETLPRLRFPEFQDAPEWKEKTLDQLVNFQSGGTPSKTNPAFWNGSVPWVSAKDMKQFWLDDAEDRISTAAVDDGAKVVPLGTLLMLVRGMTLLKDVPICVLRREMSFNQDVKALRPIDGVNGLFLAWLLTGSKNRLLDMVTVAGHGTGKLDTDELKAMPLVLPSPPEQHRIASCLASLDDLIAAQRTRIDALKTHKQGLMQQLFPSSAEATA